MLNILVIEDNEDDAHLLETAFKREKVPVALRVAENGAQAVSYLEGTGPYANRHESPFPNVIFTDLKMPVMDGFAVLKWLKTHPGSSVLPVMVLSASQADDDVESAYRLGANAYMVKPSTLQELQVMVRTAHEFWKSCAKPKRVSLVQPDRN